MTRCLHTMHALQVKLRGEKCKGSDPYVATVHYLCFPRPSAPVACLQLPSSSHSPLHCSCDPGSTGQNSGSAEVDPADACAINIRWPSASACSLRVGCPLPCARFCRWQKAIEDKAHLAADEQVQLLRGTVALEVHRRLPRCRFRVFCRGLHVQQQGVRSVRQGGVPPLPILVCGFAGACDRRLLLFAGRGQGAIPPHMRPLRVHARAHAHAVRRRFTPECTSASPAMSCLRLLPTPTLVPPRSRLMWIRINCSRLLILTPTPSLYCSASCVALLPLPCALVL